MWISALGSLVQVLSALWAFRASSHPFENDRDRNRHLFGFSLLLFIGLVLSFGGLYLNYRSQTNDIAVQGQRYAALAQQNNELRLLVKSDQEPTLSIEHVGYLPIPGNTEILGLAIRNVGKSPALQAHTYTALARYTPDSRTRPGLAYSEKDAIGNTDIPPQNPLGIPIRQHIPRNLIREWENDKGVSTFLFGSIWFANTDKKETEFAFCYKLVGDEFWQPITPKTCR